MSTPVLTDAQQKVVKTIGLIRLNREVHGVLQQIKTDFIIPIIPFPNTGCKRRQQDPLWDTEKGWFWLLNWVMKIRFRDCLPHYSRWLSITGTAEDKQWSEMCSLETFWRAQTLLCAALTVLATGVWGHAWWLEWAVRCFEAVVPHELHMWKWGRKRSYSVL